MKTYGISHITFTNGTLFVIYTLLTLIHTHTKKMKIFSHRRDHSKIVIAEISNGLTGREALQLEEFLYNCLDEGNPATY